MNISTLSEEFAESQLWDWKECSYKLPDKILIKLKIKNLTFRGYILLETTKTSFELWANSLGSLRVYLL